MCKVVFGDFFKFCKLNISAFENRNCTPCMKILNSTDFWICLFRGYNVLLVSSNSRWPIIMNYCPRLRKPCTSIALLRSLTFSPLVIPKMWLRVYKAITVIHCYRFIFTTELYTLLSLHILISISFQNYIGQKFIIF